ncbi:SixA phosphatase family protein, partial [Actinacidiphila rubida]
MTVDSPRTVVLLRHAKADWPQVPDHERPLADRGRLDAPSAGRRFADDGISPDLALCSTATRTRETWKLVAHEMPHRPKTVYEERLYDASLGDLIALVGETPDDVSTLLLVG